MQTKQTVDVLLIGAGAMSTCLGTLLNQLDPGLSITMVERLDQVARESTDTLNNAGTGHAGYCELNYTPQLEDGSIDASKACDINAAFEISLQLWRYLVEQQILPKPEQFINPVPHISFVWGKENVAYLRQRYATLHQHHLFKDMVFSDDPEEIKRWIPLIMQDRDPTEKVAATRVSYGTDVNFGQIAYSMTEHLMKQEGFELKLGTHVNDLKQLEDGTWDVSMIHMKDQTQETINAKFVFLGVGGGALPLLQKSDIPEAEGYAGFPVSGQWLICENQNLVTQHDAKVYGKAEVGAPPMSVPHLDTRVIRDPRSGETRKALLFGPFAGFTTKFLKYGSKLDLIKSTCLDNIKPMTMVGLRNMDLTRYLISEALQSHADRVDALKKYYPDAREADWVLEEAGQRVQIIKKCDEKGGKLEFGTEVVTAKDGSLAALLGASPGASITAKIMLEVIEQCFKQEMIAGNWQQKIKQMIPSYGESLVDDEKLLLTIRQQNLDTLDLLK